MENTALRQKLKEAKTLDNELHPELAELTAARDVLAALKDPTGQLADAIKHVDQAIQKVGFVVNKYTKRFADERVAKENANEALQTAEMKSAAYFIALQDSVLAVEELFELAGDEKTEVADYAERSMILVADLFGRFEAIKAIPRPEVSPRSLSVKPQDTPTYGELSAARRAGQGAAE